MTEIPKKLPEQDNISPQPFDIFVRVMDRDGGKKELIPIKENVKNVAANMDGADRKMDLSRYPNQSFGNIVVCDQQGKPLKRLSIGLLNGYLVNREGVNRSTWMGRRGDGVRDFLANPSKNDYENMILDALKDPVIVNQVSTEYTFLTAVKAEPVKESPEDVKLTEAARIKAEAQKKEAELKASKWTDEEIMKLLATIEVNNAVTLPGLKVEGDKSVEDPRRGDPEEFSADLIRIKEIFALPEITIEGRKKETLTPEAKDLIIAAVLSYHLETMGYAREVTDDGKIIVHDIKNPGKPREDAKILQEKLDAGRIIFPDIDREFLKSGDNVPRMAHAIAVSAYYHEGKDLMSVQQNLRKKAGLGPMFHISPEEIAQKGEKWKEYTAHREKEKKAILENKNLTASEVSFLLSWNNEAQKGELIKIAQEQTEWVDKAVENWNKKSTRQKEDYIKEHPIKGSMGKILAAVIGGGALLMGLKMTLGPNSKWYERLLLGPLALMIGIPLGGSMIEGGLKAIGATDAIKNTEMIFTEQNRDNPYHRFGSAAAEKMGENIPMFMNGFNRLLVSSNRSPELTGLLANKEMEGVRTKYSVTDMLYVLSNSGEKMKGDKWKPADDKTKKEIETSMATLSIDDKESLKEILLDSWQKFSELESTKNIPPEELKKQKLTDVIVAMDTNYGWVNWMPTWAGGGERDKLEAMKEMMPNANQWLDFTVGDIRAFVTGTSNIAMGLCLSGDPKKAEAQKEIIKKYIDTIGTNSDELKLREVINK